MPAVERFSWEELLDRAEDAVPALARLAPKNDREGVFPHESIGILHDAGLLTASVGERYGGSGIGHGGIHRLLSVIGRADPSVALIASLTLSAHLREARAPYLPADFYGRLLEDSAREPTLINSLQVEPQLGTPSRGGIPQTVARRVTGGWRVGGHKVFSTGASGLRWMVVLAATDEQEPRVGSFIVEAAAEGVEVLPTWSAVGMRATVSDDVVFRDVFVPEHLAFDLQEAGPRAQPSGPGTAIPSIYLGAAFAARDWLLTFLRSRVPGNLGHPLIDLPRFQAELGEIQLRLTLAEQLLRSIADDADAGRPPSRDLAWAVKTEANRAAIWAVERSVSLIGNPGVSRDNPLERHLRDVLCARIHFPQEDVVIGALGKTASASGGQSDEQLSTAVRIKEHV